MTTTFLVIDPPAGRDVEGVDRVDGATSTVGVTITVVNAVATPPVAVTVGVWTSGVVGSATVVLVTVTGGRLTTPEPALDRAVAVDGGVDPVDAADAVDVEEGVDEPDNPGTVTAGVLDPSVVGALDDVLAELIVATDDGDGAAVPVPQAAVSTAVAQARARTTGRARMSPRLPGAGLPARQTLPGRGQHYPGGWFDNPPGDTGGRRERRR